MAKIRKPYDKRTRLVQNTQGESKTKQQFKTQCDVNHIIQQYDRGGVITHGNAASPQYGVAPKIDYHSAMNIVVEANAAFEALPANVRKRFDNDPAKFMDVIHDEKYHDDMVELGLLIPKEEEVKTDVSVPGSPQNMAEKMDSGQNPGETSK